MDYQAPYELSISDVRVETNPDNSEDAVVTFKGRQGVMIARQSIKSHEFSDLFQCCQQLAREIFAREFRMNSVVDLDFELTGEDGITVWHTHPSTYLKMPLTMSMKWSCLHLKKNYKSFTSLGVVEMPSEFKLIDGKLPVRETIKLILNSMESGIEFMGMLIVQRDQIDHDKEVEAAG